jgi:hypothetical protein
VQTIRSLLGFRIQGRRRSSCASTGERPLRPSTVPNPRGRASLLPQRPDNTEDPPERPLSPVKGSSVQRSPSPGSPGSPGQRQTKSAPTGGGRTVGSPGTTPQRRRTQYPRDPPATSVALEEPPPGAIAETVPASPPGGLGPHSQDTASPSTDLPAPLGSPTVRPGPKGSPTGNAFRRSVLVTMAASTTGALPALGRGGSPRRSLGGPRDAPVGTKPGAMGQPLGLTQVLEEEEGQDVEPHEPASRRPTNTGRGAVPAPTTRQSLISNLAPMKRPSMTNPAPVATVEIGGGDGVMRATVPRRSMLKPSSPTR